MVLPLKRKAPVSTSTSKLSDADLKVLQIIKNTKEAGISKSQIKKLTGLIEAAVTKSVNILIARNLIKEFTHVTYKRSKHYIGVEFNPSTEVGGGHWYSDGIINVDYVTAVRRFCLHLITKMGIASVEELTVVNSNKGVFPQLTANKIDEIVQALVLDGELEEKFHNNKICYGRKAAKKMESGIFGSFPCGVCPRVNECTPDGVISPGTCVYMSKWLEF